MGREPAPLSPADRVAPKPLAADLVADDLRPEMAGPVAYGQRQAITPNIDKLAASAGAVTFAKAYCQQAVCGTFAQPCNG